LRQEGLEEDRVLPAARHAWAVERRREGPEPWDDYDGVIGLPVDPSERVFSASQLTQLGQCPFRWFSEYLLHLTEPDEADDVLTPLYQGRLSHRALQRGMQHGGSGDARQRLLEALEEAFCEAELELRPPPLPAWEACRAELLDGLRRAVEAPDFIHEGAEIAALEREFRMGWCGLQVTGRIDRIDRLPEGLLLIDYKNGAQLHDVIKDAEGRAKLDIQLPLYQEAAAALFPGEAVAAARYYSLSKAECLPAAGDAATLEALADTVRQRLAGGSYPVDPDIEQKVCRYCPFDLVCRRGARLSRKGAPE
jgi:RecB family exonuclease